MHGKLVQHLMHDGKLRPHIPTAGVRVTESAKLRYDVPLQAPNAAHHGGITD
ncbi:MAG: hypothetical protein M3Z14_00670 [Candidatus Eremiobacteraeota bacterium]|nr:hypothetical protein [Candidatus Eremiobacteraeota bacterium]